MDVGDHLLPRAFRNEKSASRTSRGWLPGPPPPPHRVCSLREVDGKKRGVAELAAGPDYTPPPTPWGGGGGGVCNGPQTPDPRPPDPQTPMDPGPRTSHPGGGVALETPDPLESPAPGSSCSSRGHRWRAPRTHRWPGCRGPSHLRGSRWDQWPLSRIVCVHAWSFQKKRFNNCSCKLNNCIKIGV